MATRPNAVGYKKHEFHYYYYSEVPIRFLLLRRKPISHKTIITPSDERFFLLSVIIRCLSKYY